MKLDWDSSGANCHEIRFLELQLRSCSLNGLFPPSLELAMWGITSRRNLNAQYRDGTVPYGETIEIAQKNAVTDAVEKIQS